MEVFWMEHRYNDRKFDLAIHYEIVYQILLVMDGKIEYMVGSRKYTVSKGGIVVLNTLENHTLKVLEYPYERYIIQIRPEFFQNEVNFPEIIAIFLKRSANFSHVLDVSQPIWNYMIDVVREIEQEYKGQRKHWESYVGSNLRRMFITLFRECESILSTNKTGAGVTVAYNIMNYLNHHFAEDMSVDHIAAKMFLNKNYIAHVFKNETGYSLMGYVITLRVNQAKLLLSSTDKSITDIAQECGYSDFNHFSKQFKKVTNMSPRAFRKTAGILGYS